MDSSARERFFRDHYDRHHIREVRGGEPERPSSGGAGRREQAQASPSLALSFEIAHSIAQVVVEKVILDAIFPVATTKPDCFLIKNHRALTLPPLDSLIYHTYLRFELPEDLEATVINNPYRTGFPPVVEHQHFVGRSPPGGLRLKLLNETFAEVVLDPTIPLAVIYFKRMASVRLVERYPPGEDPGDENRRSAGYFELPGNPLLRSITAIQGEEQPSSRNSSVFTVDDSESAVAISDETPPPPCSSVPGSSGASVGDESPIQDSQNSGGVDNYAQVIFHPTGVDRKRKKELRRGEDSGSTSKSGQDSNLLQTSQSKQ